MARVIIDVRREHATGDEECTGAFEMIDIVHCLARLPYASARKRLVELANSRNYLVACNAEPSPLAYRATEA